MKPFSQMTSVNPKYFGNKERITIRFDRDVLEWFRNQEPGHRGYQSRINQALREYMKNNVKSGAKSLESIIRQIFQEEVLNKKDK